MKKYLLLAVCTFFYFFGFSQTITLTSHAGVSDIFNAVSADAKIQFSPSAAKALFGLNDNADLVLAKTENDKLGFIHYRFYQSYKNIPIDKSMFTVHTKNGLLQSMSGSIVTDFNSLINKKFSASVTTDKAINTAIAYAKAKVYAWQNAAMQQRIKDQTNNAEASFYPKANLVFYNPQQTLMPRELRLCYKVNVYALQPLSNADYFVDAQTGNVIGKEDKINFADVTGTAQTAYSGAQIMHSDKAGNKDFRLRDYSRGSGIITLHGESGWYGNDYHNATKNWTLAGFDKAAMDAHYGVEQTYSFYMVNFGRDSYDGAGTALYSYVNEPTYIDNAFWDGSAMNFNKRSDGDSAGVTGIDVTGHELTHGVTQTTCALNYSYEPGAINESLSDIMGKSVQFWAKPTDINWLIGNDMNWIVRDMSNPNAYGQPDTYKGILWYASSNDNGGVHYNSGVGNFMFYLLVTGGSGNNDNGESYNVSGIGLSKADQIIYRSQTVYLTQTCQYIDWRTACINAAVDLYGMNSNEVAQVKNAFHAVGIGLDASGCEVPTGLSASNITKTSANLSWTAVAGSHGYDLEWKLTSANKYKIIKDLTTNAYSLDSLTAGYSYDFRVQNKCASANKSSFGAPYTFYALSRLKDNYCVSQGTNSQYEFINRVTLSNLDYTSGNNNGYANFINLKANIIAGNSYTINLTPGFSSSAYTENWTVFADWNHDGDFTDAGEMIGSASGSTSALINFSIPINVVNGLTRMRVQMHYNGYSYNPCATLDYGEVEDYSLNISGGTLKAVESENNRIANTAASLAIVPNPVKSYSAIASLSLKEEGNISIYITDLSGRLLLTQQIANTAIGKNTFTLSRLDKLNNGIYMLAVQQNGAVVARAQLTINR